MLFRGVDEGDLALWVEASERKNDPVDFWRDVVGVEVDRLQDASVFRMLEWRGMEVR
jgi:ubiquitin C